MEKFLTNAINYNSIDGSISLGETTTDGSNTYSDWHQWWPDYERTIIKEYYPVYWPNYVTTTVTVPGKLEQAFKIAGKLIEKKIIEKELTVKDFVELVNEISDLI